MAQLIVEIAVSYILNRLQTPNGPRAKNLTSNLTADFGKPIPLVYGPENRLSGTCIWATPIKETVHKHKPALDYVFGIVGALLPAQKTYTYSISLAVLIGDGPMTALKKIWANSKLIFDADATAATAPTTGAWSELIWTVTHKTHKEFDSVTFYPGNTTQGADPTMEAALGVGNVPGYRRSAYVVIKELQLADFGNAVPNLEFLVEGAATAPLRDVVEDLIDRAGVDLDGASTSSLSGTVRGYVIADQKSVSDALVPLSAAYHFDVADIGGGLRFIPRGRAPTTVILAEQLGGQEAGGQRPEPVRFTREPETTLPQLVTVSFSDPARDYQTNTQATPQRVGGSAESNINLDTGLVLTPAEARPIADELQWEAWAKRQAAAATTDDRRIDVQATQVHCIKTPNGLDTFRVLRRQRGVNGVTNLDLEAERPVIYGTSLTAVPAPTDPVEVAIAGPINTPIIFEPPSTLSGSPQVWIAVSGGDGTTFDPTWTGVTVYVATQNVDADYALAGFIDAPAFMGKLTAALAAYASANPDTVHTLSVNLTESGGELTSAPAADAAAGVNLSYVGAELLTFRDASATSAYHYDTTNLYRALHGTTAGLHAIGADFALLDDAIFRYTLPAAYIGVPLYFKFVQRTQSLADVTAHSFTPAGTGYGGGSGGVPTTPTGGAAAAGGP